MSWPLLCFLTLRQALRPAALGEWHAEGFEQSEGLLVGATVGRDRHVEATGLVDLVVIDLGEDDLLAETERVVAASVERARVDALEVADSRHRHREEAIQELVLAVTAQRHGQADGHALAQLELRDRLARAADVRLLPGDLGELVGGGLEQLRVLLALTHTHVDGHLHDLGSLHRRVIAKALDQRGANLVLVPGLQTCSHQSILVPLRRATRTRLPSTTSTPTRVGLPSLGSTSATLEIWIPPSFSITPLVCCAVGDIGLAFWCRLIMFSPSTNTRSFLASTRSTRPCLPRSLPLITTT